ncbi:MAG: hypothetical protein J0I40_02145, partial [Cellulomonas sp.]|nr:hypothetical protein [Cellulomonas sp.]
MADHLRLADPRVLSSKRRPSAFNPNAGPLEPDRPGHARTLAGMLAGIEGQVGGRFERDRVGVDEEDRDDAPPVVLVVTGRAALDYGPFRRWGMDVLTEGSGNTLMVLSSSEAREVFADLVDEYGGDRADWTKPEAWRKQLDAIESVRLYDARDRADGQLEDLNFESLEVVDVLLWASMAERSSRRA